jgi:hypothetical protein
VRFEDHEDPLAFPPTRREVDVARATGCRHFRDFSRSRTTWTRRSCSEPGRVRTTDDRRPVASLGVLEPAASGTDGTKGPRGGFAEDADAIVVVKRSIERS